jgi:hypothetical protein
MGYYSSFEEISNFNEDQLNVLSEISGIDLTLDHYYLASDCKWYEFEKDLKELSLRFPDTLFAIERVGEENPDMERVYAKNGKSVSLVARVLWPEFKEDDLK